MTSPCHSRARFRCLLWTGHCLSLMRRQHCRLLGLWGIQTKLSGGPHSQVRRVLPLLGLQCGWSQPVPCRLKPEWRPLAGQCPVLHYQQAGAARLPPTRAARPVWARGARTDQILAEPPGVPGILLSADEALVLVTQLADLLVGQADVAWPQPVSARVQGAWTAAP